MKQINSRTSSMGSTKSTMKGPELTARVDSEVSETASSPLFTQEPCSMSAAQVMYQLKTDHQHGLSGQEIGSRRSQYGENALDDGGSSISVHKVLLRQVCNAMIMVLIVSMAISFGIRDFIAGGVIAGVVIVNVVVGFTQEYGAEKTMASLRLLSSPSARVIRDGGSDTIAAQELVPGDIIIIQVGDTIPADARLIEAKNLEVDESLLTGEAEPVAKNPALELDASLAPGDKINMVYSSSCVTKGRGLAAVTGTGMNTEIGKIALSLRGDDSSRYRQYLREARVRRADRQGGSALDGVLKTRKRDYAAAMLKTARDMVGAFLGTSTGTPLHRTLARLSILLFGVAVVLAIVAMAAQSFIVTREVAVYAIALALSMIPASLVVVLTITMAMGAQTMVQRNVVVRKLESLEALGATTDICSDKTGTLTQGKMIAKKVWLPSAGTYEVKDSTDPLNYLVGTVVLVGSDNCEAPADRQLPVFKDWLTTASLANNAVINYDESTQKWSAHGDPTEIAAAVFVNRMDMPRSKLLDSHTFVHENPFDSTVKRMSSIFRTANGLQVYAKGASERVLGICNTWTGTDGAVVPFTDKEREQVQQRIETLASEGLRVLSFATRTLPPGFLENVSEKNEQQAVDWSTVDRLDVEMEMTFQGLIGIYDPPRRETKGAVEMCGRAGINVHMLTGDHQGTAKAIAQEVGILPRDLSPYSESVVKSMIMTASEFDALTETQIDALPVLPLVVARCAPQTKVNMVEALRRRRKFTAMTGDGVNDSPSLKNADIGIAMGLAGSDVAKDASDIVLSDDNFASILNAVEEGRRMIDNIQKFVLHLLAGNVSQVLFLLVGLSFKDGDELSVFPLSPVEILWIIMITSSLPAMGLGMLKAAPDVMQRPPKPPKKAVFTWEVIVDLTVYGLVLAMVCFASFVGVVYVKGDLGRGCNSEYSSSCDYVFRARSMAFVQMTWALLLLAWEVIDTRRSLFHMHPDSGRRWYLQTAIDLWSAPFLFWSVVGGIVSVVPLIYIPVINKTVFKHSPITWEWGVSVAGVFVFMVGVELYKWCKRVYYRRKQVKTDEEDHAVSVFNRYLTM